MSTYPLTWMAPVLRAAGLRVVEVDGWTTRGRPASTGGIHPTGVMNHHTAGPRGSNAPSLGTVTHGRPDLPGPLCHILIGRDGTVYLVAAGRANHAGASDARVSLNGHPGGTDGNAWYIGIEIEHCGTSAEPWSPAQVAVVETANAALLKHLGHSSSYAIGHKEWAPSRKIDPYRWDMAAFRANVAKRMSGPIVLSKPGATRPPVAAKHSVTLRRGDTLASVSRTSKLSLAALVAAAGGVTAASALPVGTVVSWTDGGKPAVTRPASPTPKPTPKATAKPTATPKATAKPTATPKPKPTVKPAPSTITCTVRWDGATWAPSCK